MSRLHRTPPHLRTHAPADAGLAGALLAFALGTTACQSPPEPSATRAQDEAAAEAEQGAPTAGAAADHGSEAPEGAEARDPAQCCKFCLDGTPCGDACVEAGASCDAAPGCACEGELRPTPTFRKGDRALQGLIAADVAAYNAAQGDPIEGNFDLPRAFEGDPELADPEKGTLHARFTTTAGAFECELYEAQAPLTVANFVGLARGTRPYLDPKEKAWKTGPYFEGILFHRVIEGFMIQTGDPTGTGTGGPGYLIPDEFHPKLRHVGPGILSMANRNRVDPRTQKLREDPKTGQTVGNTGSSQFFVTVAPTPHLDGRHTIFGRCADAKVPVKISKVETITNRALGMEGKPREDVSIEKVEIFRR